ncbi:hypothetical protein AMTR_s00109p00136530 [Amborella trichopoda]|uniref:Uncharacterized protein n=1 Tax=Amborella trichopoda TaxID=13333 RepID=W1NU07_AMBTC|nr:hypothetical protein AMTR_s00109p00136530 [Amborella trichopoda]
MTGNIYGGHESGGEEELPTHFNNNIRNNIDGLERERDNNQHQEEGQEQVQARNYRVKEGGESKLVILAGENYPAYIAEPCPLSIQTHAVML